MQIRTLALSYITYKKRKLSRYFLYYPIVYCLYFLPSTFLLVYRPEILGNL